MAPKEQGGQGKPSRKKSPDDLAKPGKGSGAPLAEEDLNRVVGGTWNDGGKNKA